MKKIIKIFIRLIGALLIVVLFFIATILYENWQIRKQNKALNANIEIWKLESSSLLALENLYFNGIVIELTKPIHRQSTDSVIIKLLNWESENQDFKDYRTIAKSQMNLIIIMNYQQSIWPPNQILVGDSIVKLKNDFYIDVYTKEKTFKKRINLLYCDYEDIDTVIKFKEFEIGLMSNRTDTLYIGQYFNGNRNGKWTYFEPQTYYRPFVLLQGEYKNGKRNGMFTRYYEHSNQIMYRENYLDGKLNGESIWWYDNGNIESHKQFYNGNRKGEWIYYNRDKKVIKKEKY